MVTIGVTSQVAEGEDAGPKLQSYVDGVTRAGARPLLLPWRPSHASDLLARVDAVLLTGGPDVDPAYYGKHPPHPSVVCAPPLRDAFEIELARMAFERGVPALGICRGVQVMNVALGGSLVQDISAELPAAVEHQQEHPRPGGTPRPRGERTHGVEIVAGSLLSRALGERARRLRVNSMHHQAVRIPAPTLRVVAYSVEDAHAARVVEGLEAPAERHPFYLGVQWHPEELARSAVGGDERAPDAAALFDALAQAARRQGALRT